MASLLVVVIVVVVVVVVADVVEGQEILSRPRPEKRAVPASLASLRGAAANNRSGSRLEGRNETAL